MNCQSMTARSDGRRRGSAMALVLVAMALAFVLGLGFLSRSTTVTAMSQVQQRHAQAQQISESGLAVAVTYAAQRPDWRSQQAPGVWLDALPLYGGEVTVEAAFDPETNDPLKLTATGRLGETSHLVSATAHFGTYAGGTVVQNGIDLANISYIDSFDSSEGPYAPDTADHDGLLVTNATDPDSVRLDGSSTIHANVKVGAGADPDTVVSAPERVTGETDSLARPIELPDPPQPPDLDGSQDDVRFDSNHTLDESRRYGALQLTNSAIVEVQGDIVLHVDSFRIRQTAQLIIPDGSSLTLYVETGSEFGQQTQTNVASGDPARMIIFGLGAGYEHEIHNKAQVYAILDAPNSDLRVTQQADFYGAFLGRKLVLNNEGGVHLDRNVQNLNAGPRLPSTMLRLTPWTER